MILTVAQNTRSTHGVDRIQTLRNAKEAVHAGISIFIFSSGTQMSLAENVWYFLILQVVEIRVYIQIVEMNLDSNFTHLGILRSTIKFPLKTSECLKKI